MPYFDKKHIAIIENEIRSGKNVALKSRRNKKYVSGNALYRSYVSQNCKNLTVLQKLLSEITREQILLTSDVISYFVADDVNCEKREDCVTSFANLIHVHCFIKQITGR